MSLKLPLKIEESDWLDIKGTDGFLVARCPSKTDAAELIRLANQHAELLAALSNVSDYEPKDLPISVLREITALIDRCKEAK